MDVVGRWSFLLVVMTTALNVRSSTSGGETEMKRLLARKEIESDNRHLTEDAQQNLAMRDLRLEIVDMKGENTKLWEVVNRARRGTATGGAGGGLVKTGGTAPLTVNTNQRRSGSGGRYGALVDQLSAVTSSLNQLKNGVGDLKTEWLLLKREVEFLRGDQLVLRDNATKLTSALEAVKAEWPSSLLRPEPNRGQSLLGATRSLEDATVSMTTTGLDPGHVRSQLVELRMMTSYLEGELVRMRRENADILKELVTSGLLATNRNLSREELGRMMDRIANIRNGSRLMRNAIAIPKDCHDVYKNGHHTSGVYEIRPDGAAQLDNIYCEMVNGSGWTVIQRRVDGGLSFVRKWSEYKHGFGNHYGEFWAGNELIHRLTTGGGQRDYRLRIDIWDFEGGRFYAEYDLFRVDSEQNKYRLHVRGYSGNSGDSLSYHDDMAFSTEDVDSDLHIRNCAIDNKGGWWFNSCFASNLNGLYHLGRYPDPRQTIDTPFPDGIVWYTLKETEFYSLKRVEMKVRPVYL